MRRYNSAEWLQAQQIRERVEMSKICASPPLPNCAFCSVKVEHAARAPLLLTGAGSESCSQCPPQSARGQNWLSASPRLWGGWRAHALADCPSWQEHFFPPAQLARECSRRPPQSARESSCCLPQSARASFLMDLNKSIVCVGSEYTGDHRVSDGNQTKP